MRALFAGLPSLTDVRGWLRAIFSRDRHPLLQFIRYGIAGVMAMGANVLFFALAEQWLFPIRTAGEVETLSYPGSWSRLGPWLGELVENQRVFNYIRCNVIAFLMANAVAYVLNFKWVFQSGRHSRHLEVILFFAVSLVSFVLGTALASALVGVYGLNEYVAKLSDAVAAILINYVCRKFLIFQN